MPLSGVRTALWIERLKQQNPQSTTRPSIDGHATGRIWVKSVEMATDMGKERLALTSRDIVETETMSGSGPGNRVWHGYRGKLGQKTLC